MSDNREEVERSRVLVEDHCTCQFGRDHDGSEFGPCPFCEEQEWLGRNGFMNEEGDEQMSEN